MNTSIILEYAERVAVVAALFFVWYVLATL